MSATVAPDTALGVAFWIVVAFVALIGVAAWGALILEEIYERGVGDEADRALAIEETAEASRVACHSAGKPYPSAPLLDPNGEVTSEQA